MEIVLSMPSLWRSYIVAAMEQTEMYQLLYEENVVDPDTSKTCPFRYESFHPRI